MAVGAVIENGKIMESAAEKSVKSTASNKNGMDKDAFLQLLVAQMKYQDPLQPTSNTEYISQYATFSQVEQMQNMASTMELSRASALVGEYVNVEIQDSNGDTKTIEGKVDYVTYENGKAYVSIDGESYLADNVKAVVDQEYQSAFELTVAFIKAMNSLPAFANLTAGDKEAVETLQKGYNSMSSYQQSFIPNEYVTKLQKYVESLPQRMRILLRILKRQRTATRRRPVRAQKRQKKQAKFKQERYVMQDAVLPSRRRSE